MSKCPTCDTEQPGHTATCAVVNTEIELFGGPSHGKTMFVPLGTEAVQDQWPPQTSFIAHEEGPAEPVSVAGKIGVYTPVHNSVRKFEWSGAR